MKKVIFHLIQLLVISSLILTLQACGSRSGGSDSADTNSTSDSSDTGSGTTTPSTPSNIVLSSSLPSDSLLSQGGQTTITAIVSDEEGNAVQDGTIVSFTSTKGSITSSDTTVNGHATATFQAGASGGIVTIEANAGSATSQISVEIASGSATSISRETIVPSQIGIVGGGSTEAAIITFKVLDDTGNPVSDGTTVDFALKTPLGGGESISPTSATTTSGAVQVALRSGTVAGVATVTATTATTNSTGAAVDISTEARVTIVSGLPDDKHFSLSADPLNIAGYVESNLESTITAYLADRYSNPVPVDTPVSFYSEGGFMVVTDGSNPTNLTDYAGRATAIQLTADPRPDTVSSISGTPGHSTILAATEGQESFVDSNGNGVFDTGESFTDLGEPFIDADDDGIFDVGTEFYVDADNDGAYTGPNGAWDANTLIWTTIRVLWSANTASTAVSPSTFAISDGGSQEFTYTPGDVNGNPLTAGSTVDITASGGTLSGETSITIPDATFPTTYSFNLADATAGDAEPPKEVKITIKITSADNLNKQTTISGIID